MQFRAWFFGLLGFVFAITGVLWYEMNKPTLPAYTYNARTDSPDVIAQPLSDLLEALPELLELERARAAGLGLAAFCFFVAWRNSIGYTAGQRHREIMSVLQPAPQAPQPRPVRSRFDDSFS
jgi:hypothetical protein